MMPMCCKWNIVYDDPLDFTKQDIKHHLTSKLGQRHFSLARMALVAPKLVFDMMAIYFLGLVGTLEA